MNSVMKRLVLVCLSVVSCFLSVKAALYVARNYFFDQFYYGKSEAFGYWVAGRTQNSEEFGNRSKDVRQLYADNTKPANILGATSDDTYTIAVIGDSEVWGLGALFEETFPQLLQKKLGTVRKTRVLSLGSMGDDVVDNLTKYKYLQQHARIDLYIFVPVSNDIVINQYRKYANDELAGINKTCEDEAGIPPTTNISPADPNYLKIMSKEYINRIYYESYANDTNWCILRAAMRQYPKDGAMYFAADDIFWDTHLFQYMNEFKKLGMYTFSSRRAMGDARYARYWTKTREQLRVSAQEDHPSALAHRMYADVLFDEITNNPRWRFSGTH